MRRPAMSPHSGGVLSLQNESLQHATLTLSGLNALSSHGRYLISSHSPVCFNEDRLTGPHSQQEATPQGLQYQQSANRQTQSAVYYATLLRFCSNAKALLDGQLAHDLIIKSGMDQSTFLQNRLIQMYGHCGSMEHAFALIVDMHWPDRYSWSFMIKGYAQQGNTEKALQFFHQMQCVGMLPDKFIFVSMLSACLRPIRLADGKHIHALLVCTPTTLDAVVGTALANMYGKCGDLQNAERVFSSISHRDLVSWNAMIALYDQFGQSQDALNLFEQMLQNEVLPDEYTFVTIVSACTGQVTLMKGRLIHNKIVESGLESTVDVGNAIINMYVKGGWVEDARKTFDNISVQNVVSWTAMIAGYFQHGLSMEAVQLLDRMQWEGVFPDKVTFISILASLDVLSEGKCMHAQIMGTRFVSDVRVGNGLLNMYINCGSLQDALLTFNQMPNRELVSWTTMMAGFAQHGQVKYALELLEQMRVEGVGQDKVMFISILSTCASPTALLDGKRIHVCIISCGFESDIAIGNALINMYRRCGPVEDALTLFERMGKWNNVTFISMLSACADQAALQDGKWLHSCIVDSGSELEDVVQNALLTMYGRCGSLVDAQVIFDKAYQQNLALWNAMIEAYAQNGQGKDALQIFSQMWLERVIPNEATFISVISACSHAGLVDEGYTYLVSMYQDYGITAEVDHYNCMVDLLGRVGRLDEAEKMINNMPCRPTSVSWMTLLSACREQVDVKRGESAAERASALDCQNTAPYIILASIYHAVGREEDSARLIRRMRDVELEADFGTRTADMKGSMHRFQVDNLLHFDMKQFAEIA